MLTFLAGLALATPADGAGGAWPEPERLGKVGSAYAAGADIGDSGYALVGWEGIRQGTGSSRKVATIGVSRSLNGPWETEILDKERSEGVQVGIAEGEDRGIIAWNNKESGIKVAIHSPRLGVRSVQTLSSTGGLDGDPILAVASNGTAVVVWGETQQGETVRYASIRRKGQLFRPPVELGEGLFCGAAAANGGAVAVACDYHWNQDELEGKKGVVVFATRRIGHDLEPIKLPVRNHPFDVISDATVTKRGRVDLTLYDDAQDPYSVVAARAFAGRPNSGRFETISTGGPNYGNGLDSDGHGNLLAAWYRIAPYQARFSTRANHGQWQGTTVFGPFSTAVSDLDVASSGEAIVGLGARDDVDSVRIALGTVEGLTEIETVGANTNDPLGPAVGRNNAGDAVVAWTERVNGKRGVFVSSKRDPG